MTIAEPPRDNMYKSMHKKVKSTVNQGMIIQNEGQSGRQ